MPTLLFLAAAIAAAAIAAAAGGAVAGGAAAGGAAAGGTAAVKPNLMFVLLDDWGYANLGLHNPGNPEIVTPNMDKLISEEGLELSRNYVFKYCSPSRCALQSGRNPIHVNVVNSPMSQHNEVADPIGGYQGIPLNMSTISGKLKSAGYATHAVGKWNAVSGEVGSLPLAAHPSPLPAQGTTSRHNI
jgi:arylsulfatase A-like enzyme